LQEKLVETRNNGYSTVIDITHQYGIRCRGVTAIRNIFEADLAAFICSTDCIAPNVSIVLPERSVFVEGGHIGLHRTAMQVAAMDVSIDIPRREQDEHRKN
jgi:hypothetical protein